MLFFDRMCLPSTELASLSLLKNSPLSRKDKRKEAIPGVQGIVETMVPELPSCRVGCQWEEECNQTISKHHLTLTKAISFVKPKGRRRQVNICFCCLPLWPVKVQVTVPRAHPPHMFSEKKVRVFPNNFAAQRRGEELLRGKP